MVANAKCLVTRYANAVVPRESRGDLEPIPVAGSAQYRIAMGCQISMAAMALIAAGCFSGVSHGPPDRASDAIDVYEAAFSYRLAKQSTDIEAYLAVDGKNPAAELITRLRRRWPNLKPASEEPEKNGYRITAEQLKWIDAATAELRLHSVHNTQIARDVYFADYRVVRRGGQWVVEHVSNETMS